MRNNNTPLLNDISEVKLIDDFTVEIRIAKDIEFELDDAIHINEIVQEIGKGERLFHLTIYGDRTVPTKEARSYSISNSGSQLKMAEAIVVQSLSQKMIFNFMINVERPIARTKLFTDVQAAQDWLKSINN